ncbi:GNAT family N-acetyltransferase [Shimia sp. CNT1-13L.2]|uniref:GNAT family N-acetyltransferase n=1 Tax=Shimia sp. CNT1-13L.2 TaxID=2959663 RepID=UPI0020CC6113|nr:GNAT family N-acetyltransferase [Shimia sp. CNT1-13L.2]MCP9484074.1 GNAT family N-acetyltransferase [Shimia sp. CNT1-13L.2]
MVDVRLFSASQIADPNALFALIDRVQAGVPYNDTSGSMLAKEWAPKAIGDSKTVLLAFEGAKVLGYCFGQPYQSYEGFLSSAAAYDVEPETCMYLSEFGVDASARNSGVGTKLLGALIAENDSAFESILVRTMLRVFGTDEPNPAIAFYEKAGFELVRSGGDVLVEDAGRFADRPRVFLRWRKPRLANPT